MSFIPVGFKKDADQTLENIRVAENQSGEEKNVTVQKIKHKPQSMWIAALL